jgi:hypothetical protein
MMQLCTSWMLPLKNPVKCFTIYLKCFSLTYLSKDEVEIKVVDYWMLIWLPKKIEKTLFLNYRIQTIIFLLFATLLFTYCIIEIRHQNYYEQDWDKVSNTREEINKQSSETVKKFFFYTKQKKTCSYLKIMILTGLTTC